MKKTVVIALACLVAGFAAARYSGFAIPNEAGTSAVEASEGDATATIDARLQILEQAMKDERQARQLLQEELVYVTEELAALRTAGPAARSGPVAATSAAAVASREAARQRRISRNPADRLQNYVDAGFAPDRAQMIVQREAELRMQMMEARYEAQRTGNYEPLELMRELQSDQFRDELGPVDYERYLKANGRPTSILISGVIDTSPAQRAGLQPGDSIVSYDGSRVYNMGDLNRATLGGETGEMVVVDIVRDGVTMQVAMPRGPLGVIRGGRRR